MSELRKIGRILPTRKNAEAMLALTSEELARAGAAPKEIWDTADPENTPFVESQMRRLRRHPERYLGIIAGRQGLGGSIEGFVKYNTWRVADQLPFEDGETAAELQAMQERGDHDLRGKPLGIFALHAANTQPRQTQLFIVRALADEVIARNPNREIRIGLHESDPAAELLVKRGFEPTGKYGHPLDTVRGYRTQLHLRPPAEN